LYVHADALPLPRNRARIRNFLHRDRGGNARGKPTCIGRLEIYFPSRPDETASSRAPPRKSKCENDVTRINSHASAVLLLFASREIIPPDSTRVEEPWEYMYWSRLISLATFGRRNSFATVVRFFNMIYIFRSGKEQRQKSMSLCQSFRFSTFLSFRICMRHLFKIIIDATRTFRACGLFFREVFNSSTQIIFYLYVWNLIANYFLFLCVIYHMYEPIISITILKAKWRLCKESTFDNVRMKANQRKRERDVQRISAERTLNRR